MQGVQSTLRITFRITSRIRLCHIRQSDHSFRLDQGQVYRVLIPLCGKHHKCILLLYRSARKHRIIPDNGGGHASIKTPPFSDLRLHTNFFLSAHSQTSHPHQTFSQHRSVSKMSDNIVNDPSVSLRMRALGSESPVHAGNMAPPASPIEGNQTSQE